MSRNNARGGGFYIVPASTLPAGSLKPVERRGTASSGCVAKLFIGQGYGFVRAGVREIYFHRHDLVKGTSINDLNVGDTVTFELFDDRISGARALRLDNGRPRR